jgi:catechol 2,3-dioxygenase-like lactoylglutathione lyase family enzyme
MPISGLHAMFYTQKPEELRAFFRDILEFPYTDTGDGWLVFDAPQVDIGCHPSEKRFHEISFFCDDIHRTMEELRQRGVEFTREVKEEEWGFVTYFRLPDGGEVELYQPKYEK